jgi:hypothetical protein
MLPGALFGLLLAAKPAGADSLMVNTSSDAGAPCPVGRELATALKRRLPGTRVEVGEVAGPGSLGLSVAHDGTAAWRLRVARPDGEVVLAREVRGEAGCAAVVETCVLIVDRYLTAIALPGRAPRMAADAGPRARVGVSAGLGAWAELPARARPALSVEISLRARWLLAALWGAATDRHAEAVILDGDERGTLSVRRLIVAGALGACRELGRGDLCGGAAGGATMLSGGTEGPGLVRKRGALAAVPAAGVFGRLGWRLGQGLQFGVEAIVTAPLGTARLGVEGTAVAASAPLVEGLLSGRLGWWLP